MKNVEVRLTPAQLMMAGYTGTLRRVASIQSGHNKNIHAAKSDWATDIDGAASEIAVAQHLNVFWYPTVNTFKAPDVSAYQVRSTTHHDGHLIVRKNDNPDERFVFVLTRTPIFILVGSMLGREAMVDEFFRRGCDGEADAWWVPQGKLGDLPE